MLEIFRQTAINHHVELRIAQLHRDGKIKIPIYLSLGTEHIPPSVMSGEIDWKVFPQHRCHSWALTCGLDPTWLIDELTGATDGNHGMMGSASLCVPGKMFGHDGLLGSNLPVAAGYAHCSGNMTLAHMGDAAMEEDYALGAIGYAVTKKIPLLVVVESNGLSILTPVETRRSWSVVDVAKGFGMTAVSISDDPILIRDTVKELSQQLPALVEIRCCRHLFHQGSGNDGPPEWDRYSEMKAALGKEGEMIESEIINDLSTNYS